MKLEEKIIFSNTISQTEFLRSLARRKVSNFFGARVLNTSSLCAEILERKGIVFNKPFLSNEELSFKVNEVITNSKFKEKFISFKDILNLSSTIAQIRMCILEDSDFDYKSSEYKKDDNISIISYVLSNLKDDFYDKSSLVRETIKNCKDANVEVYYFEEEENNFSPLEKMLLDLIKAKKTSIFDFAFVNKNNSSIKEINANYGEDNEVEEILTKIFKEKMSLDECLLVLVNPSKYISIINKYSKEFNIPVSFATGRPIIETSSFKLFNLLRKLDEFYLFNVEGYRELFESDFFNLNCEDDKKAILKSYLPEILGRMKISFDKESNQEKLNNLLNVKNLDLLLRDIIHVNKEEFSIVKEGLTSIVDELSSGFDAFFNNHKIFKDYFDELAYNLITTHLEKSKCIDDYIIRRTYLDTISEKTIELKTSEPGKLHVVSLRNALGFIRKNVFILGLDSSSFPGQRIENYLISDEQLEILSKDAITSRKKIDNLNQHFDVVSHFSGENVYLSYSHFNMNEVKEVNPSSKIYSLFSNKDIVRNTTDYFSGGLKKYNEIGKEYLLNHYLETKSGFKLKESKSPLFDKVKISATNLEIFTECEMKFYGTQILGIEDSFEERYERIINPLDFGTLCHYLLSFYKDNDFLKKVKGLFSSYLKLNIPQSKYEKDLKLFEKACLNGQAYLKNNFKEVKEFEDPNRRIHLTYKNKLELKGRFDALGVTKNGEYVLIDFKTDKSDKRDTGNREDVLQMLFYLYVINNSDQKLKVSRGEYFYLNFNKALPVDYSEVGEDNEKKFVEEKLDAVYKALESRCFNTTDKSSDCTYCPMAKILGKKCGR